MECLVTPLLPGNGSPIKKIAKRDSKDTYFFNLVATSLGLKSIGIYPTRCIWSLSQIKWDIATQLISRLNGIYHI